MKILLVASLFEPFVIGGAEICASQLAHWLVRQGHAVAVLTTAPDPDDACWGRPVDGYRLYRVTPPRPYPVYRAAVASGIAKPLWHLMDHADPRNARLAARVLAEVQPDVVNIHAVQGLGYNLLAAAGDSGVPVVMTLHDLSLGCVQMQMFRHGRACPAPCLRCRISARVKRRSLDRIAHLRFIAPSRANWDRLNAIQPLGTRPVDIIPNPLTLPVPRTSWTPAPMLRFLYAGRLSAGKGVALVMDVLATLADRHDFTLTLAGSGPEEAALRARFGDARWVRFLGHADLQTVVDTMAGSDLLLVPSILVDNAPGVLREAASVGLPVMASRIGGIPELVREGVDGMLVAPGSPAAWRDALARVLADPRGVTALRDAATAHPRDWSQDRLGARVVAQFERAIADAAAGGS